MVDHLDIGKEVNDLTEPPLIQLRTGKVFGENVFEPLVFLLNAPHGLVDDCANLRRVRSSGYDAPSCVFRYKEDILRRVFVLILFKAIALSNKLLILCLEAVRDVFQKNQPENNRLVFRSVDVASKDASCIPNLFFKSNIACICFSH